MKLIRIQCKRTKGWSSPIDCAYMGRPSRWGNPFVVDDYTPDRDECIRAFEEKLRAQQLQNPAWFANYYIAPLIGYEFASFWCPIEKTCHVDVWIKIFSEYELIHFGRVMSKPMSYYRVDVKSKLASARKPKRV